MTTAADLGSFEIDAPARRADSRVVEFMLVGGGTIVLFPIAWILRKIMGIDDAELAAGFLTFWAAYVVNDPHFAVTYLLFYRDVRKRLTSSDFPALQRVRFAVSAFVVPALLFAWSAVAMWRHSAQMLGVMIQLMYLLVGWHYVKQGFGVMTVLAARRGVRFSRAERLAILAHCYAGWAYAWASPFDPGRPAEEKGVVYMTIAQPHGLERLTHVVFLATIAPLVYFLARKWLREKRLTQQPAEPTESWHGAAEEPRQREPRGRAAAG
ncbi:MAG: hypothetical protein ACRELY_29900, partial [Polyangiaceae bacterium]